MAKEIDVTFSVTARLATSRGVETKVTHPNDPAGEPIDIQIDETDVNYLALKANIKTAIKEACFMALADFNSKAISEVSES